MGRLIPAGTGLEIHRDVVIAEAQQADRQPDFAGDDFDREVQYLVEGQQDGVDGI
jgi:hypothetical protein